MLPQRCISLCFCRLMIGFMLPTWFLSMWISNTATTAMMIPVVEAVLQELQDSKSEEHIPGLSKFSLTCSDT